MCNQTPGVVGVCRAWKYAWTFSVSGQNTHNKWNKLQLYTENFDTYFTLSGAERVLPICIWGLWCKWQPFWLQSTVCCHMPATCVGIILVVSGCFVQIISCGHGQLCSKYIGFIEPPHARYMCGDNSQAVQWLSSLCSANRFWNIFWFTFNMESRTDIRTHRLNPMFTWVRYKNIFICLIYFIPLK